MSAACQWSICCDCRLLLYIKHLRRVSNRVSQLLTGVDVVWPCSLRKLLLLAASGTETLSRRLQQQNEVRWHCCGTALLCGASDNMAC